MVEREEERERGKERGRDAVTYRHQHATYCPIFARTLYMYIIHVQCHECTPKHRVNSSTLLLTWWLAGSDIHFLSLLASTPSYRHSNVVSVLFR